MNEEGGASPKETITFFYFFLWEYQRRNKKYIEDFDRFVELVNRKFGNHKIDPGNIIFEIQKDAIIKQEEAKKNWAEGRELYAFEPPVGGQKLTLYIDKQIKDELDDFKNKYGRFPRFYEEGITSDEIINRLIDNKPVVTYKEFFSNDSAVYQKLIADSGLTVDRSPSTETSKPTIEVDINKPKELVLAVTDYFHSVYSELLDWERENVELKLNARLYDSVTDHISAFLKKAIHFYGWDNFKAVEHSRLIGLWMYDYLIKHDLMDNNRKAIKAAYALMKYELKKQGFQDETINEIIDKRKKRFKDKDIIEDLQIRTKLRPSLINILDDDGKSIRRWLSTTEKCIEAGKIVAISRN